MLSRNFYLKPGRDTRAPQESVAAYVECLEKKGRQLQNQRVCVVGAGGGWGIGVHLLEAGASQVVLQEPYAPERAWQTERGLTPDLLEKYFTKDGGNWSPKTDRLKLDRRHLDEIAEHEPASVDLIFSNSVLEHVTNVEGLVAAMTRCLKPTGETIHFVDLRDHYFQYPFEMLCYTKSTWERWLNASNTLNRLRLPDYEKIFQRHFKNVDITRISSLAAEFTRAKARIRSEFLTGDDSVDSTAIIRVEASLA